MNKNIELYCEQMIGLEIRQSFGDHIYGVPAYSYFCQVSSFYMLTYIDGKCKAYVNVGSCVCSKY